MPVDMVQIATNKMLNDFLKFLEAEAKAFEKAGVKTGKVELWWSGSWHQV